MTPVKCTARIIDCALYCGRFSRRGFSTYRAGAVLSVARRALRWSRTLWLIASTSRTSRTSPLFIRLDPRVRLGAQRFLEAGPFGPSRFVSAITQVLEVSLQVVASGMWGLEVSPVDGGVCGSTVGGVEPRWLLRELSARLESVTCPAILGADSWAKTG